MLWQAVWNRLFLLILAVRAFLSTGVSTLDPEAGQAKLWWREKRWVLEYSIGKEILPPPFIYNSIRWPPPWYFLLCSIPSSLTHEPMSPWRSQACEKLQCYWHGGCLSKTVIGFWISGVIYTSVDTQNKAIHAAENSQCAHILTTWNISPSETDFAIFSH